jgi:hypothetical protein
MQKTTSTTAVPSKGRITKLLELDYDRDEDEIIPKQFKQKSNASIFSFYLRLKKQNRSVEIVRTCTVSYVLYAVQLRGQSC